MTAKANFFGFESSHLNVAQVFAALAATVTARS
jgi:hypothetical protein